MEGKLSSTGGMQAWSSDVDKALSYACLGPSQLTRNHSLYSSGKAAAFYQEVEQRWKGPLSRSTVNLS